MMTVVTDNKKGVAARRSDRAEAPGARAAAESEFVKAGEASVSLGG